MVLAAFVVFLVLKIIVYQSGRVFFDEGVYTGIANYFISAGFVGYFESLRPLILPLILAPFQLIYFNRLIIGRAVGLALIFASILIVYYSSYIHFGKRAAFYASLVFAASSSVVYYGGYILVDVPAAALTLLSTSVLLKKRYTESGLFAGLAFLFKFPAVLIVPVLFLFIIYSERRRAIKPLTKYTTVFIATVSPYLIFNFFMYSGSLFERLTYPMMSTRAIIESPTWIYRYSSAGLYILYLFSTEFIIMAFAIVSVFFLYRKDRNPLILFVASVALFLIYFGFKVPMYDPRYVITFLPFLAVMAGVALSKTEMKLKGKTKYILIILIILPGICTAVNSSMEPHIKHNPNLARIIKEHQDGHIYTNTAFPILYTDEKITLYPGPNLGRTFIDYMNDKKSEWFIMAPDGYPCPPIDTNCTERFKKKFSTLFSENEIADCGYLHGERIVIVTKKEGSVGPDECAKKIGIEIEPANHVTFFRISGVDISDNGDIKERDIISKVISLLKNYEIILTFDASRNNLSADSVEFIKNISKKTEFGVVYLDYTETENFIKRFENQTGLEVTYIIPELDDWKEGETKIPGSPEKCIRGSWDQTYVPIECREIDIFSADFSDVQKLLDEYKALKKADYEIGIDIPVQSLNTFGIKKISDFIGSISR